MIAAPATWKGYARALPMQGASLREFTRTKRRVGERRCGRDGHLADLRVPGDLSRRLSGPQRARLRASVRGCMEENGELRLADTAFRKAEKKYKLHRWVCKCARLSSPTQNPTLGFVTSHRESNRAFATPQAVRGWVASYAEVFARRRELSGRAVAHGAGSNSSASRKGSCGHGARSTRPTAAWLLNGAATSGSSTDSCFGVVYFARQTSRNPRMLRRRDASRCAIVLA
jgi:hypothetical protein